MIKKYMLKTQTVEIALFLKAYDLKETKYYIPIRNRTD